MSKGRKIAIGIAGSSGSIYAKSLLDKLANFDAEIGVVMSTNAKINWELENGIFNELDYPFSFYNPQDFSAPFASGSAKYDCMIICPASMGIVGRIASGISNDLMSRSADVMLKERRKLILVPRETPLNLIHLRNMTRLTEAGAIICPAIPSFYSQPKTIFELVDTVTFRILDLAEIENNSFRWSNKNAQ